MLSHRFSMNSRVGFDCRYWIWFGWIVSSLLVVLIPLRANRVKSYPNRSYFTPTICFLVPNQFL